MGGGAHRFGFGGRVGAHDGAILAGLFVVCAAFGPVNSVSGANVAGGGIAKKFLQHRYGIEIYGYMSQLGPIEMPMLDRDEINNNAFFDIFYWKNTIIISMDMYYFWVRFFLLPI